MDNFSLIKKPKIETPDGVLLDLASPTVHYDLVDSMIDNMHFVTAEEEGRLDKIAAAHYAWADRLDAILWANNLYNPFAISEEDYLRIPKVKDSDLYATTQPPVVLPDREGEGNTTTSQITKAASKLNRSTAKAVDERTNKLKSANSTKGVPPNMITKGRTYKEYDSGVVLLG